MCKLQRSGERNHHLVICFQIEVPLVFAILIAYVLSQVDGNDFKTLQQNLFCFRRNRDKHSGGNPKDVRVLYILLLCPLQYQNI